MYIGNNRGLLAFDGIHWDLVKLPNNLGVRALYISKEGRIYVGSFEEFGYFEVDDENDLIYHSLSSSEINVYLNNDESGRLMNIRVRSISNHSVAFLFMMGRR